MGIDQVSANGGRPIFCIGTEGGQETEISVQVAKVIRRQPQSVRDQGERWLRASLYVLKRRAKARSNGVRILYPAINDATGFCDPLRSGTQSVSLLRVKRTWVDALHMSAFDPKRTSAGRRLKAYSGPRVFDLGERW
jgi:hypothetical protein